MFPHSNQRAELGVKVSKRLIRENKGPGGTLNTDKFCRAMMAYRNTPDRDTSRSPAEVLFGKPLRDHLPSPWTRYKPREEGRLLARDRESALAKRAARAKEELTRGTRDLGKLTLGDNVRVRNQTGEKPTRWDDTGVVVKVKEFDQYLVKMDRTGRLSLRNRKFLRKIIPYGKSETSTQYHDNDDAGFCPTPRRPKAGTQYHDDDDSSFCPIESGESGDDYNDGRRLVRKRSKPDRLQVTGAVKSYKPSVQTVKVTYFPLRLGGGGGHKRGLDLSPNLGCAREHSDTLW